MPSENRDNAYLWDMLDHANVIIDMMDGVTLEKYRANQVLRLAMERAIEIIGEAARRISDSFRDALVEDHCTA